MQEYYLKSLQMIKELKIRSVKEYNELLADYKVLNVESLKYMARRKRFTEVVKLAKKVA